MLRVLAHMVTASALVLAVGCGSDDPKSSGAESKKPAAAPAAAPTATQNPAGMNAAPTPAGDTAAEAPPAAPSGLVPKLEALADEACKCKSKDCAGGVQDKIAALLQEAKEPSKEEAAQMGAVMQRAQECIAKAQAK